MNTIFLIISTNRKTKYGGAPIQTLQLQKEPSASAGKNTKVMKEIKDYLKSSQQ